MEAKERGPPLDRQWYLHVCMVQATAADETGGMNISEGRSEDSAGMGYGLNTRLQWPRAAAAHAAGYETDERGSSVLGLAIERRCAEIGD